MENIISIIGPYLPYIGIALSFLLDVITLAVRGQLDDYPCVTVAAVYRVGIHGADALADEGMAWLRSEAGVAYRRSLIEQAYDLQPVYIGVVPVGL